MDMRPADLVQHLMMTRGVVKHSKKKGSTGGLKGKAKAKGHFGGKAGHARKKGTTGGKHGGAMTYSGAAPGHKHRALD